MGPEIFLLIGLALGLGFKHSYDADHVVAVSNILARSDSLRKTSLLSTSWAVGHMITAGAVSLLIYTFREAFLAHVLHSLELLVAAMLIAIGVVALLWEFNVLHVHEHWHGLRRHRHVHAHLGEHAEHGAMFSIGIIHGVASNDELLVLLVVALGVTTLGGLLFSVLAFSLGVVLGMILFGLGLTYPILRWGEARVRRIANVAAAVLSLAYGALIVAGYGGLSLLPL